MTREGSRIPELDMINRSAVVVRPKQPYIDWALGLDDSGLTPDVETEQTIYLFPSFDDDVQGKRILRKHYQVIFESELEAWHLLEDDWPQKRTYALFLNWFEVSFHSMVEDLGSGSILDEDI
jgi:hypothetical protein